MQCTSTVNGGRETERRALCASRFHSLASGGGGGGGGSGSAASFFLFIVWWPLTALKILIFLMRMARRAE